jgi:hypothetical protein
MAEKDEGESLKKRRVVLDAEDIRIDADPLKLGELMHNLITDAGFRESFHKDPLSELRSVGISVPERLREKITRENVNATLESLIEGSYASESASLSPAVGVVVGSGTAPATVPRVYVVAGIQVATGTSTFSFTLNTIPFERKAELWSGLAARQAGQRAKKADFEKLEKELEDDSKTGPGTEE